MFLNVGIDFARILCSSQLGNLGPSATGIAQITAFGQHHSEGKISHKINELRMGEVLCNVQARDLFRYYANTCTFGYSFVWWQWKDWERSQISPLIDEG